MPVLVHSGSRSPAFGLGGCGLCRSRPSSEEHALCRSDFVVVILRFRLCAVTGVTSEEMEVDYWCEDLPKYLNVISEFNNFDYDFSSYLRSVVCLSIC